jgi:hypothetical protein
VASCTRWLGLEGTLHIVMELDVLLGPSLLSVPGCSLAVPTDRESLLGEISCIPSVSRAAGRASRQLPVHVLVFFLLPTTTAGDPWHICPVDLTEILLVDWAC